MKLLFLGRKPAAARVLQWSLDQGIEVTGVITDTDIPRSPTAAVARANGVPLLTHDEAVDRVRNGTLEIDIGVSFLYWRIVRHPLLGAPRLGFINFHPAPLPGYRGSGVYNRAILDAAASWGTTAHFMDTGIDTGPIVDQARFAIDPDRETAQSLERRTLRHMTALYRRTMKRLRAEGRLPTFPNSRGRTMTQQQVDAMKRIVPGDDVERKVRAFWYPPYRGAYVEIDGRKYTLVTDRLLRTLGMGRAP